MTKLQSFKDRLRDIENELEALKIFRPTTQLAKFRRQLIGEQSFVKMEIVKLQSRKEEREKAREERILSANKNRRDKMKRTWRYIKSIQKNKL